MILTDKFVRGIGLPMKGQTFSLADKRCKGLKVRTTSAGAKSFVLEYRVNRVPRRQTIGSFPAWSVADALKEATRLRKLVDLGEDPQAEKADDREAPRMIELVEKHRQVHMPLLAQTTQNLYGYIATKYILPFMGGLLVRDVTRKQVRDLYLDIANRLQMPPMANRTIAFLGKLFSVAIEEGWRTDNPTTKIIDQPDQPRQRYLTEEELHKIFTVLQAWPSRPMADAIFMLIFTGARKGEVVGAKWSEFDLKNGFWNKPKERTKQRKDHRIPLAAPVLDMLRVRKAHHNIIRGDACEFVFPSFDGCASGHIHGISINWTLGNVMEKAGVSHCRVHDLRHTYASIAANGGVSLFTLGKHLGHTKVETTARYAHINDAEHRTSTEHVASILSGLMTPDAEVVNIPFQRLKSIENE